MKVNLKPSTLFYPLPVLLIGTYDKEGNPDLRNAAWGGIYDTNKVILSLSEAHQTTLNIQDNGYFSVSFATEDTVEVADYVGLVSKTTDKDKRKKAKLTIREGNFPCPLFRELPLTLECKLDHRDDNGNRIGEILEIVADDSILDEKGEVDIRKLKPIAYDPSQNKYYSRDKVLADAFKIGFNLR